MQLKHSHTVPADCPIGGGVTLGLHAVWHVTTNHALWCLPRCLHTQNCWSSPPIQKRDLSKQMTCCHSESLHDSLAWHHCSLWQWWHGVRSSRSNRLRGCSFTSCSPLAGWLMKGTAHWMPAIVAFGSVRYSDKARPCSRTPNREIWINHNIKPIHQLSFLMVDSFWVQLFFWWWVYKLHFLIITFKWQLTINHWSINGC